MPVGDRAKRFIQNNLSLTKKAPSYTDLLIKYCRDVVDIVGSKSNEELFDKEETDEVVVRIHDLSKHRTEIIQAFFNDNFSFVPRIGIATEEESLQDLRAMDAECIGLGGVAIDDYARAIVFKKNISVTDITRDTSFNFGLFRISMGMSTVQAIPIENNTKRGSFYHPYVSEGNKVCLGGFKNFYANSMSTGRYHAAYLAVIQCLTLYGGDGQNGTFAGPYSPIAEWIGQICSICDNSFPTTSINLCEKTNLIICPACVDLGVCTDDLNPGIFHPSVLKVCTKCNKTTSTCMRGVCLPCREKSLL